MSLKKLVINTIKFYHNYLSALMLYKCRYYPSCSEYMIEAIEDKGIFLGILKGILRLSRCNLLFPGGYDPYRRHN